jgi:hypothetical protein
MFSCPYIENGVAYPVLTHGPPDRLLRIGNIAIAYYMLENGRRMLSHSCMLIA